MTCNLPGQKVVASFSSHFLGELLSLFAKTSFHFGPLCPLQTSLISFPALIFDYKAKQKCLEFDPLILFSLVTLYWEPKTKNINFFSLGCPVLCHPKFPNEAHFLKCSPWFMMDTAVLRLFLLPRAVWHPRTMWQLFLRKREEANIYAKVAKFFSLMEAESSLTVTQTTLGLMASSLSGTEAVVSWLKGSLSPFERLHYPIITIIQTQKSRILTTPKSCR